jgi:hypothetical protein
MALLQCSECGHAVSDKAAACPNCGAKPRRANVLKVAGRALALIALLVVALGLLGRLVTKPNSALATADGKAQRESAPVNFDLPLQTTAGTLVCPFGAAFDNREGRGLQAAMKSRTELFGRHADAEKAGCSEWREALRVQITESSRTRAKQWQATHDCGMLEFSEGLVFSCDLVNVPVIVGTVDPRRTFPPGASIEIYRAFMADYNASSKSGSYVFAHIPRVVTFENVDAWEGKPLTLTLLGTQKIQTTRTIHYFLAVPSGGDFECHACVPILGAVLTESVGAGERVLIPLGPLVQIGAWGKYPIEAHPPEEVSIGASRIGVFLYSTVSQQGDEYTGADLVEVGESSFQWIGQFPLLADSSGSGTCGDSGQKACEKYVVRLSFDRSKPRPYYPLIAHTVGVMNDKQSEPHSVDETKIAEFDGTQYKFK